MVKGGGFCQDEFEIRVPGNVSDVVEAQHELSPLRCDEFMGFARARIPISKHNLE